MKVLDLFSGIGGFSLGLERAGFETVAFCEIDETCRRVLKKHWPKVDIFEDVKELCQFDFAPGEIEVICGGFPCQDISVAGKGKGLKGERSGLWFEYKRPIEELKPKYVIIENVANLRSKGLVTVLQDLWSLGYDSEWHIISACGIGSVHRRERIWIVAYPNGDKLRGGTEWEPLGREFLQTKREAVLRNYGPERPLTYADDLRLGGSLTSKEEKQKWRTETAARFRPLFEQIATIEPAICRDNDGLQKRLDKPRRQRIKQLGNAVLPQIPQIIGEEIMKYEERRK